MRKISFKKAKSEASTLIRIQVENAAMKLLRLITAMQRRLADHLQKISERYSRRTKIIALVGFVVVGSLCNLLPFIPWLHSSKSLSIGAGNVSVPARVPIKLAPVQTQDADQLDKIQDFQNYLDSLKHSPGGIDEYNKTMEDYPGLMDSLREFQRMYPH